VRGRSLGTHPHRGKPAILGLAADEAVGAGSGSACELQAAKALFGRCQRLAGRAAQVDAYRNLAEQVYGFRVWGNTTVSAFVTQNDAVRTYVDAFIRGARVVGMSASS